MTIALMLMGLKEYKPVDKGVLETYWQSSAPNFFLSTTRSSQYSAYTSFS